MSTTVPLVEGRLLGVRQSDDDLRRVPDGHQSLDEEIAPGQSAQRDRQHGPNYQVFDSVAQLESVLELARLVVIDHQRHGHQTGEETNPVEEVPVDFDPKLAFWGVGIGGLMSRMYIDDVERKNEKSRDLQA